MLFMLIKSVVSICALVLVTNSFANSLFIPEQRTSNSMQSSVTAKGFIYPVPTLNESDFIETGVLFVYNDHILDYFNGDSEKLLDYVNANIEHNNQAFVNSNIPLKRVVSGLIRVESDDLWSSQDSYTERLHALARWQRTQTGKQIKQQRQNSYLVSLAGLQISTDVTAMLGQAFVGDDVSWISPFNTDADLWIERTLSHELSHNDGFKHATDDYIDGEAYVARYDAAGYKCGSHGSIMHVSGLRTEPFFSDADIQREEQDDVINCGAVGEANAAQVYRDLLTTTFANSESTFKNIQPTRLKTGVVSIHENVSVAMEGYNIEFDIVFEGADAGDSVNFVARQGTAGLEDFISTIGSVTHDGINNVYTISMPTLTDNLDEALEHFSYELVYPNGVSIDSANASIQASIFDKNDNVGYVEFSTTNISVVEGDTALITINRFGGNEGLITYHVETFANSATHSDFEPISQALTFNNGETSKILLIKTMADSNIEQDENFTVKIIQTLHPLYAANADVIRNEVKVTINNPVEANSPVTISNSPAVSASNSATTSTNADSGQAGGGSINILWTLMLLSVVIIRYKRKLRFSFFALPLNV
ncbi:MAG: hypothetical protein ACJA0G_001509 [Kangiellaceae bacterium]|jgi:hypothetical protein